jgi:hypothetical protein
MVLRLTVATLRMSAASVPCSRGARVLTSSRGKDIGYPE